MKKLTLNELLQQEGYIKNMARRCLGQDYAFWADDAAQEALIKAYSQMDSYDKSKGALSTWLGRITRNHCSDIIKKKDNNLSVKRPVDYLNDLCETPLSEEFYFKKDILRKALSRIGERYQTLLLLKYTYQMSAREIAAQMDIPEKNVATYMMRAKDQLRRMLEHMGYAYYE